MRKLKTRLLSWVLCVCLLLPECSMTALAAETTSDVQQTEETTTSEEKTQEGKETDPEKTTDPEEMKEGETPAVEETPESTQTPSAEETPESGKTPADNETPAVEETPESIQTPSAEETESPEAEETEQPGQTPAADASPSEMPSESPVQTEVLSEVPVATPAASEATLPTGASVRLEEASEAVELTLDMPSGVSIATGGEVGWAKFTAAEEGDYIFYTDTNNRYDGALYKEMSDEAAVLQCDSISYYGVYAMYHMNAGETVYWKLAYDFSSGIGTITANVKKKTDFPGTLQDVKINAIPYGFEIELTWLTNDSGNLYDWRDNTNGVGGAPMSLAYSADSAADFESVEEMMKVSGTEIGSVPDGIKIIPFECIESSYSDYSLTMKVTTANDMEMSADTEYQFAIFANVNNRTQGYNGFYWWDNVYSGKVTAGAGVEATQVAFDENNFVAKAGYAYARGSVTVTNPAKEPIVEKGFYVAKGSETAEKVSVGYWKDDDSAAGVFEGSYLFGTAESCTLTPYAVVRDGKEGTIKEIKGTPKTVTKKDPSGIKDIFKVEPATAGAAVTAKFDLQNEADSSLRVVYTIMDADGNTVNSSNSYASVTDGILSFDKIIPEGGKALTGGVNYKVKLELANTYPGDEDYQVLYSKEFDFTPKEIVTYTEEDIPDEALRAILSKKINSDVLTSDKLEKITYLYVYGDPELSSAGAAAAVKSLKGIEYLPNLETLVMTGQDIKDISMLPSLKKLEWIDLDYNDIEEIPDFSQNESLRSLDLENNLIAGDEFTADKFSEKIKQSQEDLLIQKQRSSKELSINISDVYYNNLDGKTTLAFEVEGCKYNRSLELTVTVGNTEYKIPSTDNYNSSRGFTVETDLTPGEHSVVVKAVESFGGREKTFAEKTITVKKPEEKALYQKYLREDQSDVWVDNILIPYSDASEKVTDFKLVDKGGNTVGIGEKDSASLNEYSLAYEVMPDVFNSYFVVAPKCFWGVFGSIDLVKAGLSGSFDLVVSTSAGKTYTFEDYVVTEYKNPLVTEVYRSSDYDNAGDYFYLEVQGEGLNYSSFYPVLVLEDGREVTECVSYIGRYSDRAVYKLKKLPGFPEDTEVAVKIVTKKGYDKVNCLAGLKVYTYTGEGVVALVYNAKTKEYILYASSELEKGTALSWTLCSEDPSYDYAHNKFTNCGTIYGTAKLTYTGNKTVVDFRDEEGNFCEYFRNNRRYFGVSFEETESNEYSKGEVGYWESGFGKYEQGQVNTTQLSFTGELYQTVSKQITAEFTAYNNALYQEGDVLKLTLSKYDAETKSYIQVPGAEQDMKATLNEGNKTAVFAAKFTSETMFEEGRYLLTVNNQEGQQLTSVIVYVIPDSIYQQSQSWGNVSLINGSETRVRIFASLYMKNGFDKRKLSYEFYDLQGNKVEGKKENVTDSNNSVEGYHYVTAEFSNLYDRYHYLYCRILYDGKLINSIVNPNVSYYKYCGYSEEHGQKIYLNKGVYFSYSTGVGMFAVSSKLVSGYTVGIYADETAEPITSFTVPTKGYYQFTRNDISELIEVDPELKGLYTLVAEKKGVILATERYVNVGYKEVKKNPTGIKLDETNVTLSKGDTMTLQVTITPADANTSRTWESDNESVAIVSSHGTVIAVGAGKATITATTVNGKKATCKVTVVDYSISKTDLPLIVGEVKTLSIMNGTEKVKAKWSTSDSSVATVDAATGEVKAIGRGEATITAKVSEDYSFTCKVTVTNELTGIALKGSRGILEIGDTDQLTIFFTPASAEEGSTVSYVSSNPDVVTVDEKGKVTAVNEGKATITASVVSEDSKKPVEGTFTYTVCKSDKAEPIKDGFAIHAITNVDTNLAALAQKLPEKWEWADEKVGLAEFAGMGEKEFAVRHENKNTLEEQWDTVTVKFSTIKNINLFGKDGEAVSTKLATNDENTIVRADYSVLGEDISDRLADLDLKWQLTLTDSKGIVEIVDFDSAKGTGSIRAKKAGKTALKLVLKPGDGEEIASKQLNITVVDSKKKGIADVAVILVDKNGNEISSKDGAGNYVIQKSDEVYLKNNTEPKACKITYKSSDTGVVKIGKAVSTDKTKTALTLKSAGKVQIQAVADDTLKSTQNIAVIVEDQTAAGVSLSQNTVTINTALKEEYQSAEIKVYAGFETKVESAELKGIEGATATVNEDRNGIIIKSSKAGTGTLTIDLGGMKKTFTVKVKTVKKAPAVTVKQLVKLNDLYKEDHAKFSIGAAGEKITKVTVKELGTKDYEYAEDSGTLTVKNADNQKYTVSVEFEKYKSVEKKTSVAREKESFKLSAASVSIYYTDNTYRKASLQLLDKRTGLPVDLSDAEVEATFNSKSEKYKAETEGDKVFLTADKMPSKKGDKVTLTFKKDGWRKPVKQTVTVKPALLSKASLQLGQKSLILYNYKNMGASVSTSISLKGGGEAEELLSKLAIVEVPNKKLPAAKDRTLKITCKDGMLTFAKNVAKDGAKDEELKAGTYKFNLELSDQAFTKTLKTSVSLKVVDVDMDKEKTRATVTVSKSGSIDVLNREGSKMTLKPKFKNVAKSARVEEIALTGRDAHLFEITGRSGNNVTMQLKNDSNVITKYNYEVGVSYKIQSGDATLELTTSAPLKIKLTQKKPKVKVTGEGVYSNTAAEEKPIEFTIANSAGVKLKAEKIELLNYTKDFEYNAENGLLMHKLNGQTAKGKSYTLKFNVYPEGRGDNEKPITVNYKVKIAK